MIRCMHPFTRFLLHGMSGFLSRPALVVSVVLLLPGAQAQHPPLAGSLTCSPEARLITVWKVGSPYEIGLPPKAISADLKLRAESLGCAIRVDVFPAVGFADRFFAAFDKHQEPDVLVVENRGVVSGVTMRSEEYIGLAGGIVRRTPAAIEGIASKRAIFRALEAVPGSLASLDDTRSWEFLLRTSRNHNAARLLALRSPECGLNHVGASIPWDLVDFARTVIPSYLGGTAALTSYDDAERLNTVNIDPWPYHAGKTKVCGFWGTSHLVFVQTDSTYQAMNSLGWVSSLVILRKEEDKWKLLAGSIDPVSNDEFVKGIPKIVARIGKPWIPGVAPQPAELLVPPDAKSTGVGKTIRAFRWQPSPSGDVVAEVAEFARNGDARLFVRLRSRDNDYVLPSPISVEKLPIVHGEWRWRVWSISDSGAVAFSDPKSFTY
jgi:hypothetical protein